MNIACKWLLLFKLHSASPLYCLKHYFRHGYLNVISLVFWIQGSFCVTSRHISIAKYVISVEIPKFTSFDGLKRVKLENKLCSNLPRESNRIIFQSKYYLAGSVWMQFCSKTYYFSHGIIVLVISYTNFSAINLSISLSRNHRKCSEIHDALFQSNLDEIKFHRTI